MSDYKHISDAAAQYHLTNGRRFGYPLCCQHYFLKRLDTWLDDKPIPTFDGEPWVGSGFIPCEEHQAQIHKTGFNAFIYDEIEPRRVKTLPPFPFTEQCECCK